MLHSEALCHSSGSGSSKIRCGFCNQSTIIWTLSPGACMSGSSKPDNTYCQDTGSSHTVTAAAAHILARLNRMPTNLLH